MYAIIESCGKQYKVSEGDVVYFEKLDAEEGKKVTFDNVVLMSDDKQSAAITETAALSAMFGGEALVKKHYDKILNSKNMQQLLTSASKQKYLKPVFEFLKKKNWGGATGAIIKGLIFLAASMSAYEVGHIAGDKIAQNVKTKQSEQQKIDDETLNQVIKTLMANNENIEENEKINHVA